MTRRATQPADSGAAGQNPQARIGRQPEERGEDGPSGGDVPTLLKFCGGSVVYSDGTPMIWHITLMMVPLGSATKNLRTPHGSFVSGYTILSPRETAREWTSSTSETSILIWGRIADESSPI